MDGGGDGVMVIQSAYLYTSIQGEGGVGGNGRKKNGSGCRVVCCTCRSRVECTMRHLFGSVGFGIFV